MSGKPDVFQLMLCAAVFAVLEFPLPFRFQLFEGLDVLVGLNEQIAALSGAFGHLQQFALQAEFVERNPPGVKPAGRRPIDVDRSAGRPFAHFVQLFAAAAFQFVEPGFEGVLFGENLPVGGPQRVASVDAVLQKRFELELKPGHRRSCSFCYFAASAARFVWNSRLTASSCFKAATASSSDDDSPAFWRRKFNNGSRMRIAVSTSAFVPAW
jgi:hypothetical protein